MSTAQEHAQSIIQYLNMMSEVHFDWFKDDVRTTVDRLQEAASVDPDEATRLEALASWLEQEFDSRDDDLGIAYLNSALDAWAEVEWRHARVDVRGARVLICTGGPHIEIAYSGREEFVTVEVYSGGDTWSQMVECAPLAFALTVVMENADMALAA